MKIRIKEVLKHYNTTQTELAEKLGITVQAVNSRLRNPNLKSMQEFAGAIGCEVHELIDTSEDFAHFYDRKEWLGIRKK